MYTVVSAVPFEIRETKAGQIPPEYTIPSAEKDVQVIHVDDASYGIYLDADRGTLPQTIPASEVARGLIEDFVTAQIEYQPGAKPALFALPGQLTVDDIKLKHKKELEMAKAIQVAWFWRLVQRADDDWKQWGRHRAISDQQRKAAKFLNLKKDWAIGTDEFKECPGCSETVKPGIAICPNCRCILDEEKAKNLKFAAKV